MRLDSGDNFGPASTAHFRPGQRETQPGQPHAGDLEISVIYTDGPGTEAALQAAGVLAQDLRAHIRMVVAYEVPYALPLTQPPVAVEFFEGKIRNLALQARLDVDAQIFLCRDRKHILKSLLRPESVVVMGGKKRWWRTAAQKLARDCEEGGSRVIFIELR